MSGAAPPPPPAAGGGSARRQGKGRGGGAGGTLPASGFTYIGGERTHAHAPTLNNGAPAHHLNNGSLRSLSDKKKNRANGLVCHPENFQRNLDTRYSRKQENVYLRNSETEIGFPRAGERGGGGGQYERERNRATEQEYSEPEYSIIPESYGRRDEYPRSCSHSNTFNC